MKEQSRPSIPSFLYSIVPLVGLFWISSFGFRILIAECQAASADLKPAAAERKGYAVLRSHKRGRGLKQLRPSEQPSVQVQNYDYNRNN